MILRAAILSFALLLPATLFGAPGVVLTLDGRKLEGDVHFTNDALAVNSISGSVIVVHATNIARAQLSTNVMTAQTKGSGNGLLGLYFSGTNFSGPVFTRLDETVNFTWPKVPLLGVQEDNFTVRWTGYIEPPTTETYTLSFGSDDGARVYVDGQLVADHWRQHEQEETNVTVNFKAGERRKLTLELLELSGVAKARLSWSTPSMPKRVVPQDRLYAASFDGEHRADTAGLAGAQGLLATYYNSDDFTSNSFTRIDPEIDFQWKGKSPVPGFSSNEFSIRWTGNLLVTNSGDYRFWVLCSAPIRLFINDELLSNPWLIFLQHSVPAKLRVGERREFRLEMRITNNLVPVKLSWSGPGFEKTLLARHHLSPAIAPAREAPLGSGPVLPTGIVLSSGAIVSAPIKSGNVSSIRLGGALTNQSLLVTKVSRIHMRPVASELAGAIPRGRTGVLLKNRDFIDGDFGGIQNGRIKVESVLFGNRTFDLARDVLVVVLRSNEPPPWRYSVAARDGTVLYGRAVRLDAQRAGIVEAPDVWLSPREVVEITSRE